MNEKEKHIRVSFNSPVILGFTFACLIVLMLDFLTKGASTVQFFSVYRSSLLSLSTYIRLFGHVLGHAGWEHFIGNIMLILVVGPLLEEKYGSSNILFVILTTAFVTRGARKTGCSRHKEPLPRRLDSTIPSHREGMELGRRHPRPGPASGAWLPAPRRAALSRALPARRRAQAGEGDLLGVGRGTPAPPTRTRPSQWAARRPGGVLGGQRLAAIRRSHFVPGRGEAPPA